LNYLRKKTKQFKPLKQTWKSKKRTCGSGTDKKQTFGEARKKTQTDRGTANGKGEGSMGIEMLLDESAKGEKDYS